MLRALVGPLVLAACAAAPSTPVHTAPPITTAAPDPRSDRDGDRFYDVYDACPREPGEPPDGCPDRDGDGFKASADRCPLAAGIPPDGCPDSDGDHIDDLRDLCVLDPETFNHLEDRDGCPDTLPPELASLEGVLEGVSFGLDTDALKPASRPLLDRVAAVLQRHPGVRIVITGHINGPARGPSPPMYGRRLSYDRAEAVRAYLVGRGIDPARIETRGAHDNEPRDTNRTAAGRLRNRRIEIDLVAH